MDTKNELSDIHKSRIILLEQLKHAGYDTVSLENCTINELYHMDLNNELNFQVEDNTKGNIVFVKYFLTKPLKPKDISIMTTSMFNDIYLTNSSIIILIIKEDPNSSLIDLVKQIYAEEGIFIILYNIKRLLFNVLAHSMVPEHIVLSDEEKQNFIEKYNISNVNEIPTISRFDPVAIAIFMRPDQICKITRSSVNSITSEYFRICTNI